MALSKMRLMTVVNRSSVSTISSFSFAIRSWNVSGFSLFKMLFTHLKSSLGFTCCRFFRGSFVFTLPLFRGLLHPPAVGGRISSFCSWGEWTVFWNGMLSLFLLLLYPPLCGWKSKCNLHLRLLFGGSWIHENGRLSLTQSCLFPPQIGQTDGWQLHKNKRLSLTVDFFSSRAVRGNGMKVTGTVLL